MTRRIHRCLTCQPQTPTPNAPFTLRRGYTRHSHQVCASCRSEGVRVDGDQVTVTLNFHVPATLRMVPKVADPARPTMAELAAGIDLTKVLAWHGTDCACSRCAADRIPPIWRPER